MMYLSGDETNQDKFVLEYPEEQVDMKEMRLDRARWIARYSHQRKTHIQQHSRSSPDYRVLRST